MLNLDTLVVNTQGLIGQLSPILINHGFIGMVSIHSQSHIDKNQLSLFQAPLPAAQTGHGGLLTVVPSGTVKTGWVKGAFAKAQLAHHHLRIEHVKTSTPHVPSSSITWYQPPAQSNSRISLSRIPGTRTSRTPWVPRTEEQHAET